MERRNGSMSMPSDLDDPGCCPFLVPVVADRLWMRPIGVYCRRPGRRVRVPTEATLAWMQQKNICEC